MKSFKEQIASDNRIVFMNVEEFSDMHIINGKEMPVQIDSYEQINREKRYQFKHGLYADGVYLGEVLIYVNAKDFGPLPSINRTLMLDGKQYLVMDAIDEDGIYSITLNQNKMV